MERHNENAAKVARWLRDHEKVKKIYYVGFEDHPGYSVNLSQATGFGGMISFEVDSEETAHKLLSDVEMILFAESLGGTETLITCLLYTSDIRRDLAAGRYRLSGRQDKRLQAAAARDEDRGIAK